MPVPDVVLPSEEAPKQLPSNNPHMFKIFQNVQFNVVQHKKYVKEMTKLYKKVHIWLINDSFKEIRLNYNPRLLSNPNEVLALPHYVVGTGIGIGWLIFISYHPLYLCI